jgi:hypothetical protein
VHARDPRAGSQGYTAIVPGTLVTTSAASSPSSVVRSPALGGVDEPVEGSLVLGGADLLASFAGEMKTRAGGELPGVRLADREHFGDLPAGVVERFAEHVGGSFDGRQVLEEHQHRAVERFGVLGAVRAVGLDVDRARGATCRCGSRVVLCPIG